MKSARRERASGKVASGLKWGDGWNAIRYSTDPATDRTKAVRVGKGRRKSTLRPHGYRIDRSTERLGTKRSLSDSLDWQGDVAKRYREPVSVHQAGTGTDEYHTVAGWYWTPLLWFLGGERLAFGSMLISARPNTAVIFDGAPTVFQTTRELLDFTANPTRYSGAKASPLDRSARDFTREYKRALKRFTEGPKVTQRKLRLSDIPKDDSDRAQQHMLLLEAEIRRHRRRS